MINDLPIYQALLNENSNIRLNCYTNKTISASTNISNGDNIKFNLVYLCKYNVDK
jgi:hypothetical protein